MTRAVATLFAFLLATLPTIASDWSKVAERLQKSTFELQSYEGDTYCSGWVIDNKRDYAMTAEHCVVAFAFPIVDGIEATIEWQDPLLDAAVLHVPGIDRPDLPVGKPIKVGEEIGMFGFAREVGFYGHFRVGHVSAVNAAVDGVPGPWIVTDQPVIGGMSGGPAVNWDGKVVSMNQRSDRKLSAIGRPIAEIYAATKKFWRK